MLKEKAEKIGYRVFIRFNIPQKNSEGEQIQVGAWRRLLPGVEPRHDEIIQIRTPRRAIAQRWLLQNQGRHHHGTGKDGHTKKKKKGPTYNAELIKSGHHHNRQPYPRGSYLVKDL